MRAVPRTMAHTSRGGTNPPYVASAGGSSSNAQSYHARPRTWAAGWAMGGRIFIALYVWCVTAICGGLGGHDPTSGRCHAPLRGGCGASSVSKLLSPGHGRVQKGHALTPADDTGPGRGRRGPNVSLSSESIPRHGSGVNQIHWLNWLQWS